PDTLINKYNDPHAYCVVYNCADRSSFDCAEKVLQNLWSMDSIGTKAVILVSNKADLVRSRMVSTEAKPIIFIKEKFIYDANPVTPNTLGDLFQFLVAFHFPQKGFESLADFCRVGGLETTGFYAIFLRSHAIN
ncbi:hypothetical protein GWI33_009161, partial [Rhynchophorus ferrugineus]